MKIHEILMELGDRPSEYKITKNTDDIFEAVSGDITVSIVMYDDHKMEIVFDVDNEFGITGKGDSVHVMSTVLAILKFNLVSVIDSRSVHAIFFTADVDEPSRIKLYDRFQKIMDRLLGPEWSRTDGRKDRLNKIYKWINVTRLSENPREAYRYAHTILKSAFPLGEKAIASDPLYAYYYARDILNGRFELGEPAIKKHGRFINPYYELTGIQL